MKISKSNRFYSIRQEAGIPALIQPPKFILFAFFTYTKVWFVYLPVCLCVWL